jgi:hypothetical protein
MYNRPLVPANFVVPERLDCGSYHLRMLSTLDVDKDYEAVMDSRDRLKGLLDPDSPWPEGTSKDEDLIDLAWHQREFTIRHSFAYTVMAADESRCLGCVYIFPSNVKGYEATVFYWVRSGPDVTARDSDLGTRVRTWLREVWPFRQVAFPGRDVDWATWRKLENAWTPGAP